MTSGFPKIKKVAISDRWGEVDKSVKCSRQIFQGFNIPKIINIGHFLKELFKKGQRFIGTQGTSTFIHFE